jgi:cyclopropane-fatty-acyl-phospholipid synthase
MNDSHRGAASSTSAGSEVPDRTRPHPAGTSLALERHLLAHALTAEGGPPLRFRLWDGSEVALPGVSIDWTLELRDRAALWRLIAFPEYNFPELYAQGRLRLQGDLEQLLEATQAARRHLDPGRLGRRLMCALVRPRSGSLAQARNNIHQHYDLGNDFYRLWLDEQMVYTCAYFRSPQATLEQAQTAKLELVCRKLRLRPGERVVEAGCGWGALALHMVRHHGVRVRAFNISRAQLEWARERAAREKLAGRVEFVEGDYREIDGEYDAFASVGMLEHVGQRQYPELGRVMDRCLAHHGRGLIHTIGTDCPGPMNPWIERRIFPGACPPSLGQMMPLFGPLGFSVLDVENLRQHYALTLALWLRRFEAVRTQVAERFDDVFVRVWRFYLASSQASFATGHLQLYQLLFARRGAAQMPWTRADLYRDEEPEG